MPVFDHDHEFEDPVEFIFEDVLVNERRACGQSDPRENGPACDASITVQWKVDFNNIQDTDAGETLAEDEAKELWTDICDKYGTFELNYEEYQGSGSTRFKDPNGHELVFERDNGHATVTVHVNGRKVKLHTEKYRTLD